MKRTQFLSVVLVCAIAAPCVGCNSFSGSAKGDGWGLWFNKKEPVYLSESEEQAVKRDHSLPDGRTLQAQAQADAMSGRMGQGMGMYGGTPRMTANPQYSRWR